MHLRLAVSLLLSVTLPFFSAAADTTISIIPEPVSIQVNNGNYVLPSSLTIAAPALVEADWVVQALQERLLKATGRRMVRTSNAKAVIRLEKATGEEISLGKEGYRLTVNGTGIVIKAAAPAGWFYGVQTLFQLLPKEIESAVPMKNISWKIPFVHIMDKPRFGWRGLMLDVSRHFFTKQEVKQFIDDMVRYKYNVLHFHLTDDQGWRIEIKGWPRLTEIGAWNVKKQGYFGTFSPPGKDEKRDQGGFYTQEDIKELVQYAKERFVNILPEVDVPGHSMAAVVAYPDLSGTPELAATYQVNSGEEFMDWSRGNPPTAMTNNTLSPVKENVYRFLDDIVTQLAALFPFQYIHTGGDECPKNFWEKDPAVQELMKREGLKNMDEVQSYFEKRLEKIVSSKGKKMIGWDEILHGGLAPGAAVMSWQGMKGGIEAARQQHEVVMTPTTYAYLDYMQGDAATEPHVYATLRLKKTYEFEPLPSGVDPQWIKGAQGNLWTEQIYNYRYLQYMLWPRAFSLAETCWSPAEKKNWDRFVQKMNHHLIRYDIAEKKYATTHNDPVITSSLSADGKLQVAFSTDVKDLQVYYSFDNTFPDYFYPPYQGGQIYPPAECSMMRVVTYRGKQQVGKMITISREDLLKRARNKGDN
ncbi:MAG: beta-N-acetylhexosaminidase [Bacteroidota bacterium]|jgi:hexosaminidase